MNCRDRFYFRGVTSATKNKTVRKHRESASNLAFKQDAPEKGQPFTNRAKQLTSGLTFDKDVRVETKGQDRYGRTIGEVFLPDGRNLNRRDHQGWLRVVVPTLCPERQGARAAENRSPRSEAWTVGRS